MQLQKRAADIEQAGTALFAISYDPVQVLADFTAKHGITFPLLSDEGSQVIRRLRLYNEHLAEQAAAYGREAQPHQFGVPYPGIFHLDEAGTIVGKWFEQGYRVRLNSALLLRRLPTAHRPEAGAAASAERGGVTVSARIDSETYRPYERLHLRVTLQMSPGVHIYGAPAPEGLTALEVALEPFDGLDAAPEEVPPPDPLNLPEFPSTGPLGILPAFGESAPYLGYEREVEIVIPFNIVPLMDEAKLQARVRYQACTEALCYPPDDVVLELTLRGEGLVPE